MRRSGVPRSGGAPEGFWVKAVAAARTRPADGTLLNSVMYASEKLLSQMPEDTYLIGPAVARRLMRESAVLVLDVRERAAFEAGHISRAVSIPLRELSQALNTLPDDKSAMIIVYCGNGDRGGMALTFLRLWGYTNVFSIVDGINGWTADGLPLETPDPGWLDPKRIIVRSRQLRQGFRSVRLGRWLHLL